ncbi:unnamed protein product [Rhizophagus irregularis]|nr:unnamed protein product [Rhizophagus irregularis]
MLEISFIHSILQKLVIRDALLISKSRIISQSLTTIDNHFNEFAAVCCQDVLYKFESCCILKCLSSIHLSLNQWIKSI